MRKPVSHIVPPDHNRLRLSKPKKQAAGVPAVISSGKHSLKKMGITRTVKTLAMVNQKSGFDCPGCAWPDPEHRTYFEFCENGAKAVADEATKARAGPDFFSKHSIQDLANKSDFWLNNQGRITEPMYLDKDSNHYTPISWDEALTKVSDKLKSLDSPNRAVFYTSGRTSNEAAFLYQAFIRSYGTNNLPDCSNMCHESSGKGLGSTIGIGKGTVRLEDFYHSDLILVIGQNPGTNHPRMLTALRDAKKKGSKIIHINPLPEAGLERFKHPQDYMKLDFKSTKLSDIHLQVKIGGDAALMKGLIKVHLESGGLDLDFINNSTTGFQSMCDDAKNTPWNTIIRDSGIDKELIEKVGSLCANSNATIACWAMGLTQHRNGVSVIQEVVNLLLLGGHVGRKGAGFCPVRGHSNVQGDRTVGIWEAPSDSFLDKMEMGLKVALPRKHGYDVVNSIKAMDNDKVGVFFCMGGNFISATPDTRFTAKALSNVDLVVQVSTKLNRSHAVTGKEALILPCLGRTELDIQKSGKQFVSVENSMGIVHMSRGNLKPASNNLRSEPWIVSSLADKTLENTPIPWMKLADSYDEIRDLMGESLFGFEDYNRRVRQENGFYLPNPPRDSRTFETNDKKAHFTTHILPDMKVNDDHYVMMTLRSHDQYNTTIYGLDDRYRGIKGNRRILMMNSMDMLDRNWKTRQKIDISSHYNGQIRTSKNWLAIPYDIPSRNIAAYFPEANELVPLDSTAKLSNTPTSKWIVCSLSESNSHDEEE
ncbi:MAG: FdhF/YdeP family oxidoreductase [Candidatus Poseidoniaceae archaeon]|jgi:molybdopterin-dependent oxidoreductase alpha subunit|nr:FdhF/YdeP family oxidoreductase [Candidatus Poseidoniaceae archaeon]